MAFCRKYIRNYAVCLKNMVNIPVAQIYKINFRVFFLTVFTYANTGLLNITSKTYTAINLQVTEKNT